MQTYLKDLRWGRFNLIEEDFISEIASCYGEWSEAEVMIFKLLLSDTSNVIEVGSNIGTRRLRNAGKDLLFKRLLERLGERLPCGSLLFIKPMLERFKL